MTKISQHEFIKQGTQVSKNNLLVGDLVFINTIHMGIYIGNNKIIHAPKAGDVVKISEITSFYTARRLA